MNKMRLRQEVNSFSLSGRMTRSLFWFYCIHPFHSCLVSLDTISIQTCMKTNYCTILAINCFCHKD